VVSDNNSSSLSFIKKKCSLPIVEKFPSTELYYYVVLTNLDHFENTVQTYGQYQIQVKIQFAFDRWDGGNAG